LLGVSTVEDKDFIEKNKNYLMLESKKVNVSDYLKYEKMDGINYILPVDSEVSMYVDTAKFYQTENANLAISGSLSSVKMLKDSDLIYGRMPENEKEIIIDKMVYKNSQSIKMIGLYDVSKMVGNKVYLGNHLIEYTIVGVVDLESPSIYTMESEFIKIIDNSTSSDDGGYTRNIMDESAKSMVYDYDLYKGKINVFKGHIPTDDYEVVVNESLRYTFELNK
jgi:hypothetical protein